ncbi:DUF881 domain-containing protein [Nocardioides yefusunii]|uniref:DUF881 domain-containing protein n=1 Tax=Nocardioides yefusunii TaxID=2500546 RepID=A0ABW1QU34_9ACTN|nr:DUF881 domain-containing protein [Nocardioides yefusunii]
MREYDEFGNEYDPEYDDAPATRTMRVPALPLEEYQRAAGESDETDAGAHTRGVSVAAPRGTGPTYAGTSTVVMPLLDLVTKQSMDEDYSLVAARRRAAGRAPGRRGADDNQRRIGTAATVVVVAISALVATVAGAQTSRNADVTALGRAALVERIQIAKENVRELRATAGDMTAANATLEESSRALQAEEAAAADQVRSLGTLSGFLAVTGPGIRIVVDDGPGETRRSKVRDDDLIFLVQGLWSAGAEAVAINGQRLSVLSPIQNSGQAIHVNVRPLSPPYRVEAIGDPDTLEGALLASTGGATFYNVANELGFGVSVEDVEVLELPATRVRSLRHVEKLDDDKLSKQEDDE